MDDEDEFGFVADDFGFEEGTPLPGSEAVPSGYRETGERTRVHQLPGISFSVNPTTGAGTTTVSDEPAQTYEERTIEKAPSGHTVAAGTRAPADPTRGTGGVSPDLRHPALQVADRVLHSDVEIAGRQGLSVDRLRRALAAYRASPDIGSGLSAAASTAMPTAPMPAGQDTGTDLRPSAPWRSIGRAVLFDRADELGAALGGMPRPWLRHLHNLPDTAERTDQHRGGYDQRLAALRDEQENSEIQDPAGSRLGTLAGAAPLMMLPGGQQTALARIATQAGYGAGLGALRGSGQSEATLDDPVEYLLDTATGAASEGLASGVLAGGGEALGGIFRAARPGGALSQTAAESRVAASGFNPNPLERTPYGQEVRRMGGVEGLASALDHARVGGRLPTPGQSAGEAQRIAAEAGQIFDDVTARMEGTGQNVPIADLLARYEELAAQMDRSLTGPGQGAARSFRRDVIAPLQRRIEEGVTSLPWSEAQAYRSELGNIAGFNRHPSARGQLAAEATQGAWGEASDAMDAAAADLDPSLRDAWRGANRRYQLAQLLRTRTRGAGSQLPGSLAEGTLLSEGNIPGAAAARVGGSALSRFGPGVRARGLQFVVGALRRGDAVAQRYAQVLEQAQSGGMGLPAAHFLLMRTRPDYRALFENDDDRGDAAQNGDQP